MNKVSFRLSGLGESPAAGTSPSRFCDEINHHSPFFASLQATGGAHRFWGSSEILVEESPIHFTTEKAEAVFAGHGKGLLKRDLRKIKPVECQAQPPTLRSGWHWGIVKVKRMGRDCGLYEPDFICFDKIIRGKCETPYNGRAGVPPPAADGDGTLSLPSFAIASNDCK